MDQISAFQTQYPLSRKKWWKKMLGALLGIFVISLFLDTFIVMAAFAALLQRPPSASGVFLFIMLSELFSFALLLFVYGLYFRAYIRRYYFDIGPDFITIKKGVFAPREIHVLYQKIQDVYVDQDLVDRLFGLYDVHLASATTASGIEAHIDGVDEPVAMALKELLLAKVTGAGHSLHMAPSSPQAGGGAAPAAGPVRMSEQVSSATYPIQGSYYVVSLVNGLLSAALLTFFGIAFFREWNSGWGTWLAMYMIVYGVQAIWLVFWLKSFSFEFTPDFVMSKTGVLSKSEKHVPYRTIQDVVLVQSVMERLFGICSVRIENAASGQTSGRRGTKFQGVMIPGLSLEQGKHLVEMLNGITSSIRNSGVTGL